MAIIEDDGCGFDLDAALSSGSLGLPSMRERADMLHGSLTIETRPGEGTSLFLDLPCAG